MTSNLMQGKKGLIMGIANSRSLAWAIAQSCHTAGAELAFSYQGEALKKRIEPLANSIGVSTFIECDVTSDESIQALFSALREKWGKIDFIVHSIGYADKDELSGKYLETSRANFLNSMDISCYSLTRICREAEPMLNEGGSILTLTYYGAEQVMPNYNVMGVAKAALEASVRYLANDLGPQQVRVNAISAGPVKTLAASGISDFRNMLKWTEYNAPLKRNITANEVGKTGLYLLSDLSSGMTGEILHVDSGYHIIGMASLDNAKENAELFSEIAERNAL